MKDSPISLSSGSEFIGPHDWRGSPVTIADLPSLSHYVNRALQAESQATVDAVASAGGESGLQRLELWTNTAWTAVRLSDSLQALLAAAPGDAVQRLVVALRRLRRRVLLTLITRDTTGRAELSEVVATMTTFAELAVQSVVAVQARELAIDHGIPIGADGVPQDFLVVGMGKLGGAELNVSSDIDLIFVYDEDGETDGANARRRISNHEFFAQLGRRVIALLNDATADGFVFRVDMRLRPNGSAGPLAVSNAMLEEYLMAQGREWERFAWLKGRIVSAPVFASTAQFEAQCAALDGIVRPFVFRKYLDFGAIAALRELHKLIRAEAARRSFERQGREDRADDVKLGRGGIRELEFIAQTFQIVRGGREPNLRSKSTLRTLAALSELGVLPAATCQRLSTSYVFLRSLEHALQYVDDAQTHRVPADSVARERVARLLGATSAAAMIAEYRAVQALVAEVFDGVFAEPAGGEDEISLAPTSVQGNVDDSALIEDLRARGFADPATTAQRLRAVLDSRRMQSTTDSARTGLDRLLRRALQAVIERSREVGAAHDIGPDQHFARFTQLADVIAGRNTYIALLNQFPQAFDKVMRMLAASRWATDYLVRHPILLDELLDQRLLEHEPDWPLWSATVREQLAEADGDHEQQMNLLRDAHHAQVFRLLVADLDGRLTVERLADHLSALADSTLALAIEYAWRSLSGSSKRRHRDVPRFAVIGYGKLGGKELGYESDLDLIFLYDDEDPASSETYALFARRLMTWLTAQTSSGKVFEIDLRLRPDGNAGLMVSSFAAFTRYQRNEDGHGAWPWEHQALTRARYSAGDSAIGERFEAERSRILRQQLDTRKLCADVLEMRARMLDGHPNPTALFDVKHDRGGMVDVEFIVQFLVLAHAHEHSELVRNAGNIALLQICGELQLIDASLARDVADAYRTFRSIQHRLRLNGAERARVAREEVEREAAAVTRLWNSVFTPLPEAVVASP